MMYGFPCRRHALWVLVGWAIFSQSPALVCAAEPGEHRQVLIAITSQLRGSITSRLVEPDRGPGGLAHLAPHLRRLRRNRPDLILVDAGNALTGAPDAPAGSTPNSLPSIVGPMVSLGYDAAVLGERDLGTELETSAAVMEKTSFPWLGANVMSPALPRLVAHVVVERSGLRIGIVGLVSPAALLGHDAGRSGTIRIEAIESVARNEAVRIRDRERADLVVAIGGGGTGGDSDRETALLLGLPLLQAAGLLADQVPELDLIIATRGRTPRNGEVARPNRSYRVPLIEPIAGARALTVVKLDVVRAGNRWTIANLAQETLWAEEEGDARILAAAHGELAAEKSFLAEAMGAYIAARPRRKVFHACAGVLSHAAALRIQPDARSAGASPSGRAAAGVEEGLPPVSLLPMLWNLPRLARSDMGRAVTRRDVYQWIGQDDRLVLATLTGRQVALLLVPYVRQMHGWKAPPSQVLYPGGLDIGLLPKRSEAIAPAIQGSSRRLGENDPYAVWMTQYHRFGGSGLAAKILVQPDQPYRLTSVSLRDAVMNLLSDAATPLPSECQRFLRREPVPPRHGSRPRRTSRTGPGFRSGHLRAPETS